MITFRVCGPFRLSMDRLNRYGLAGAVYPEDYKAIRQSSGCYVFANIQPGKAQPWYVARTRRAFEAEIFTDHKQKILADISAIVTEPKLRIYFVVLDDAPGAASLRALKELEMTLIKSFRARNPKLLNAPQTGPGSWEIASVTNAEQDPALSPAARFRDLF